MLNIEKIRALSKERGISMNFLCSKIGVNNHYFLDVAKKKIPVPDERIKAIAALLDTSPEYLRDETDDSAPKQKEAPENGGIDYSNLSSEHIEFMRTVSELSVDELRNLKQIIDFVKSQRQ